MDFNNACKKIANYLESETSTPIIVDVSDEAGMVMLESYFKVGSNEFIKASSFCGGDRLPQLDKLLDELQHRNQKIFLMHLSSFLKLEGRSALKKTLRSMLELCLEGKLVIVTYQCSDYLTFTDPRIDAAGLIVRIDSVTGDIAKLPTLCFVSPEFSSNYDAFVVGINSFAGIVESSDANTIYIVTTKNKADFPQSLYAIKQNSSAFEILSKTNTELLSIGYEAGTDADWNWLLKELDNKGSWNNYVYKTFGSQNILDLNIGNINSMDNFKRWAYFLALKCNGAPNNDYLAKVLDQSSSFEQFWDKLYSLILEYDTKLPSFKKVYRKRKDIISKVDVPIQVRATFCKQVLSKNEKAIHYLTDSSVQEKELQIELIDKYAGCYSKTDLLSILSTTYPALNSYLSQYDYGYEQITEYINAYKYNKLTNHIYPEFRQLVDKYAVDRIYYSLLDRRSSIVAKKDKTNSKMYFIDALGVEFLNYIRESCFSKQLSFEADLAYCELPSITSMNKEFCNEFNSYADVKSLDELKHSGTGLYNYEQTKTPIHIIKELEVIDQVMNNVEKDLNTEGIDVVYLISDHGASRLAVINEHENKWSVKEKGKHSGRCCPISDIDEKPDFAVEDNGYWSIANYDRFQGGRKACVEVHGGATLEEVIIPIIEIKLAGDKPKCEICENFRTITVSYKIKAKIQIFIARQTKTAKVLCEGKYYDAVPTENNYIYEVDMPEVKRGHHTIDVFDGTTRIAKGLEFEAKSAGASENRYF